MTDVSRQRAHALRKLADGWRRIDIWLSPANIVQLRVASERLAASEQDVMRRALNDLYLELTKRP